MRLCSLPHALPAPLASLPAAHPVPLVAAMLSAAIACTPLSAIAGVPGLR